MKISISSLKVSDEDEILPPKLQAALIQILEERNEILAQEQKFLQGMRQVVWGFKVKAVNTKCPAPCQSICNSSMRLPVPS